MDLVKEAQQARRNKIKQKNALHGWIIEDHNLYIPEMIYSQFSTSNLVKVSCVTDKKENPYPSHMKVKYIGIVNEYKGNIILPNISFQ